MKRIVAVRTFLVAVLCLAVGAMAQDQKSAAKPATLKGILLEQLKGTHNNKDWFVPANIAVEGVTAEQANWTDGKGNHSVGQLAYHLVFWNAQVLATFKGETPAKFSGNNDETFNKFDAKQWKETVEQLDKVMSDMEKFVESADDKTMEKIASTVAHVATHNAYHTGQIIYIRRLQGSWDPEKGVK